MRLELVHLSVVDDGAKHRVHVVGHAVIGWQEIVKRVRVFRRARGRFHQRRNDRPGKDFDEISQLLETRLIVIHGVVRNGADLGVRDRTAQGLGVDRLSRGTLHEVRPTEPHERRALHHDDDVRQRREISAAGDARTHDGRELRHFEVVPHDRVVVKDARGAVLAREHAALIRQVHARGINEVDDRDTAAHRGFLRAQDFLDRLRPPRSRLDGGVVGDDNDLASMQHSDARHDTRAWGLSLVLVVRHEKTDLQKARIGIAEQLHALARREFFLLVLAGNALLSPALAELSLERAELGAQLAQTRVRSRGSFSSRYASCCWRSANHVLM